MEIVWSADLAKSLPFTDTSMKMGRLSVNVLLQKGDYGQNGQKWPFVRKFELDPE
ncbi:hypothetical protein [Ligilactobacillus ruminis]|uniref:hypothetical protein n=1 Tax=Ligilactobacillus ruminis TaxID=1623 RepID=UPI000658A077|nr:hypothetical protein [Ligilactobacillus ruminis]KLA43838.1 hypothetical protein LRP_470 [Ligilactobacillus ruminis]WDC81138.1 hypothetical protein PSR47_01850 [Ligilactobacillus ruminis]